MWSLWMTFEPWQEELLLDNWEKVFFSNSSNQKSDKQYRLVQLIYILEAFFGGGGVGGGSIRTSK